MTVNGCLVLCKRLIVEAGNRTYFESVTGFAVYDVPFWFGFLEFSGCSQLPLHQHTARLEPMPHFVEDSQQPLHIVFHVRNCIQK